jgi:hypothetical protein
MALRAPAADAAARAFRKQATVCAACARLLPDSPVASCHRTRSSEFQACVPTILISDNSETQIAKDQIIKEIEQSLLQNSILFRGVILILILPPSHEEKKFKTTSV